MKSIPQILLFILCGVGSSSLQADASPYNPLAISDNVDGVNLDLWVTDSGRDRQIPVLIYLPDQEKAVPVVLFSHGLGGSKNNNAYLGNHWRQRGYCAVFMQHAGSDESVWKDADRRNRFKAMKKAASAKNAVLRHQDVHAVIDQLESWNQSENHELYQKLDLDHIGMSGHSFGALTTQAVSGQQAAGGLINYTDERIKAALLLSPSSPRAGRPKRAFGKVKIPWLLMTGTKDLSVIGNATLESRLAVYPALPPGNKYELVLYNAEHSAFSERPLPGGREPRNLNHHRAILALSTAFWDACLKKSTEARDWLTGDGALSVLEEQDRWQFK